MKEKQIFEIVYIYMIEDSLVLISVCPSEKKTTGPMNTGHISH